MKIDTKNIDKNTVISEYERKYGKGDNAKMYFAFRLVNIFSIVFFSFLALAFIGFFIKGAEILPLFGLAIPVISSPLTFTLGYLYGDKRSN